MEINILNWIQGLHNPILDHIMIFISFLSNSGWIWIVTGIVLLGIRKYRKYGIMLLLAILLGFLAGNVVLKNLIMRERPNWVYPDIALLIQNPSDFSFPSGHTQVAFAGAVILCYMNKRVGIATLLLAAATGFSRMYLYVHYPSDILAGMAMGILWAVLAHLIIEKVEKKRDAKGNHI